MATRRQTSSRTRFANGDPRFAGIGIDAYGGYAIDPTKNVESLVHAGQLAAAAMRSADQRFLDAQLTAQEKLQNFARDAESKFQTFARDMQAKFDAAMLAAETNRIDQLATTSKSYQDTIRDMLAESVRTTSTLVKEQLGGFQTTFDARVSKLEAGAFMQAGKSSVADPAIAEAIQRMTMGLSQLKTNTDEAMAKMAAASIEATSRLTAAISTIGKTEEKGTAQRQGQGMVIAWIIGAAMLMASIATPLIAFLALRPAHP